MPRHIAWFNEALVEPLPEGGLTSPDPAVSRRCLAPARALEDLGLQCSVFGKMAGADPHQVSKHLENLQTDVVVIGQISEPSRLELAKAAKHLNCFVIVDLTDEKDLSDDFIKLAEIADQVVASTPACAAAARKVGLAPITIPDAREPPDTPATRKIAEQWLTCFRALKKLKPPVSANTNTPVNG